MKKHLLAAVIAASLLGTATVSAAVITPVNRDPAGQGLNDPTAAAPVGGNPGTTIGAQRRIVYQFAADLWGSVLQSDVETRVAASFQPLECTASSGVLGSAGAWYVNRDFAGAKPGIWYHAALANALAGENLNSDDPGYVAPDDVEITSRFNANLGGVNADGSPCLTGSGWYYGLDGKTPSGKINFLDTVMHEIGHGLGFQGFINKTTGALANFDGTARSDVYTDLAYDNVEDKRFGDPTMTDALRATAMKTPGRLTWDGPRVNGQAPAALSPLLRLSITGSYTATYDFGTAAFGPAPTPSNFTGPVALVNDGSANPSQGCVASPAGSLAGKVALVDRGTCAFEIKAANAQAAGATEVIIANNTSGTIGMAEDPTVSATIPTVSVSQADGASIKAGLAGGVNAAVVVVPGQLAGSDSDGRVLLYAPTVVAGGSTFSHYDTSLTPNALQEPSISGDLDSNYRLDLSPALYVDLGWGVRTGNASFGACATTTVPVLQVPGVIAGANLQAMHEVCSTHSSGVRPVYRRCMEAGTARLTGAGLITKVQAKAINACATRPD